tara:strand:+ start:7666 stop:8097 length:432 start_codon:yes stop_codon:yes gene_type:complete
MSYVKKHAKSAWVSRGSPDRIVKKPWGTEVSWSGFGGIHGKTLYIMKDHRTSLKYHNLKNEVLFVRSGIAEAFFGDEFSMEDPTGHPMKIETIKEGDLLMVQSGSPYRITAVTDCEIIEIGNSLSDKPIRLEDDYGRFNSDKE